MKNNTSEQDKAAKQKASQRQAPGQRDGGDTAAIT